MGVTKDCERMISTIRGLCKARRMLSGFGVDATAIAVHICVLPGGRRDWALCARILESLLLWKLADETETSTARRCKDEYGCMYVVRDIWIQTEIRTLCVGDHARNEMRSLTMHRPKERNWNWLVSVLATFLGEVHGQISHSLHSLTVLALW
jgi:hypothetical protein